MVKSNLVEAQYILLKRIESRFDKQHKRVNQKKVADLLKAGISSVSHEDKFTFVGIIANRISTNLKSTISYLLDTITNIHYRSFNIQLITQEQLEMN